MVVLYEYKWCVIVCGLACFLMGFGIGANDVANNFGTSVGSKAISLGKAVMIAAVFEFIGSVLLGASVTDSVRNGILYPDAFESQPDLLLYGNLCALISASACLLAASKLGMPISTTHSIIGSLLGVGLAMGGNGVNWTYLGGVILSWVISPLLSSVVGALYYFCSRSFILRRSDPVKIGMRSLWALLLILCTIFLIFFTFQNPLILNGISCTVDGVFEKECVLKDWIYANVGISFGLALAGAVVLTLILTPLCYWKARKALRKFDEQKKYAPSMPVSQNHELVETGSANTERDVPSSASSIKSVSTMISGTSRSRSAHKTTSAFGVDFPVKESKEDPKPHLTLKERLVLLWRHLPWNRDIHGEAYEEDPLALEIQSKGEKFDPRAECFFATLQIISACVTCVVHGSNDVANAAAPLASVYSIYKEGKYMESIAVPIWILVLGGGAIGVGLTFLGHHVLKKIGMELVKMSPSRGVCMEMAMATVMIIGSFGGIPLSTTHCLVGAAIGVGLLDPELTDEEAFLVNSGQKKLPLCNKPNMAAINWKLLGKMVITWGIALVVCASSSCALFAFSIYGPTKANALYTYNGPTS